MTKLCGRRRQEIKLRLKPFYPINTTPFAPRGQSKDKLIKSDSTRPTVVAATAAGPWAFIFVVFVVAVVALTTSLYVRHSEVNNVCIVTKKEPADPGGPP